MSFGALDAGLQKVHLSLKIGHFFVELGQFAPARLVEVVEKVRDLLDVSRNDFNKIPVVPILALDSAMHGGHLWCVGK